MIYITAHNRNLTLNNDEVTFLDFDKRKRIITVQFKDNTRPTLTIKKADRCFVLDSNSPSPVDVAHESNYVTELKDKISDLTEQLENQQKVQSVNSDFHLNFNHLFGDASPLEVKEILRTYRETFRTLREKLATNRYSLPALLEYLTDRDNEHHHLECKIP